jgi:hypothetical protein
VLPLIYPAILVSNLLLLDQGFYRWTIAAQTAFLALAVTGYVFPGIRKTVPVVVVPFTICFLTWATVVGFVRFATRRQRVTWERSAAVP